MAHLPEAMVQAYRGGGIHPGRYLAMAWVGTVTEAGCYCSMGFEMVLDRAGDIEENRASVMGWNPGYWCRASM